MTNEINRLGGMYGQATRWGVYDSEAIAPTMTASMGGGGGHTPMIVETKKASLKKMLRGVDLCYTQAEIMPKYVNCIASRYDAGICRHKNERTGVIEIKK